MIPPQLREALSTPRVREFAFSDEDFEALRRLVKELTGINLSDQKRELVYGRLARRLRTLHLRTFAEYRDLLNSDGGKELGELCNAITTNLTSFFRESHHFDYLREHVLQARAADRNASRRLRIWSAGCSTGEEPYSLAMTVLEALPDLRTWDIKILATDLDSDVLARAQRGIFAADRVRALGPQRLSRFFVERRGGRDGFCYEIAPELMSLITFRQLNLMHHLPMKGPLDVIFCRNVVIYFDKHTQRELFARVAYLQRPADLLFLGHSESLFKVSESYNPIGKTIYRRC
jgi:chemotaxis protein methyltransferase CheR